ncbi:hypothetical protein M426DRAFT_29943, partial [Hypoxylon sp. CI-4A]
FSMDYGTQVSIHHTAHIDRNCRIVDTPVAEVKIGRYAYIGPNVTIVSTGPPPTKTVIKNLAQGRRELTGESVTICDGAWIGASAVIGPGVTIREGAKVAIGAVVTDDVAPYEHVAGNPAREV